MIWPFKSRYQKRAERVERHEAYLLKVIEALNANSAEGAGALYKLLSYKEPQYVEMWRQLDGVVAETVDDLVDVIDWLREDGRFNQADRLRTLAGRLARKTLKPLDANPRSFQELARTWPEQLTLKESKKIIAERDAALAALEGRNG